MAEPRSGKAASINTADPSHPRPAAPQPKPGRIASAARPGPILIPSDLLHGVNRFRGDDMTYHAAALTYYSLMSLFPGLLVGVSLLGLLGQSSLVGDTASFLRDAGAPRETVDAVAKALQEAVSDRSTAATALVVSLAVGLNGASGAFGATGKALNVIFRVAEGRNFVRKKVTDIIATVGVLALVMLAMVLIFLGGGLASDVFDLVGLGDTVTGVWRIVRWPLALCTAMAIYAVIYFAAPNVEIRRFRWITPGAIVGVLLWILASAGFFLYVSSFASYNATYGAFASVVILLVWLWLTNVALLLGAEVNAHIDLRRSPELPDGYDGPSLPEKVPAEL